MRNREYLENLMQFFVEHEVPFEFGFTGEGDSVCIWVRDTEDWHRKVAFVGPLDVLIKYECPAKVRALAALYENYNARGWEDLEEDDPRVVAHRKAVMAVEGLFALAEKEHG